MLGLGLHSGAISAGPESCSEALSGPEGWGFHCSSPALECLQCCRKEWGGGGILCGPGSGSYVILPLSVSRTESVAEKMLTNWFTFLLYKFLKVGGLGRRER